MLTLLAAVTAVRAFGISRGVLRYAERLAAHDAAFRVLGELRGRRLRAAGAAGARRAWPSSAPGDLLARLVGDVDGLADLWLRVLLPYPSAGLVAAGAVGPRGLARARGRHRPGGRRRSSAARRGAARGRRPSRGGRRRAIAPARGDLADAAVDLLRGAPELLASGRRTAGGRPDRRRSTRGWRRRSVASPRARGSAASSPAWPPARRPGSPSSSGSSRSATARLPGVVLAVVALTPIAVHEVIAPLVPAARQLPGLAASARRVVDVLDRPDPVPDAAAPAAVPAGPLGLRARGLTVRYPGRPATRSRRSISTSRPAAGRSSRDRAGPGRARSPPPACASWSPPPARWSWSARRGRRTCATLAGDDVRARGRTVRAGPARLRRHRSPTTCGSRAREPARRSCAGPWPTRSCSTGWPRSPKASRPRWGSTARACPGASASGWRSPGRSSPTSGSSSSTSPPSTSTSRPPGPSWPTSRPRPRGRTVIVLTHRPDLFDPRMWIRAADLGGPEAAGLGRPDATTGREP